MTDLIALVLPLEPAGPQPGRQYLGRAAHAWFLESIARLDPALAARLHEGATPRPFTLWPASTAATGVPFLRLTSMHPELSDFLLERWLPGLPERITLGGVTFHTREVRRSGQHPWAGQTDYADLIRRAEDHCRRQKGARSALTLEFATPTVFRSHEMDVPLPLPGLIFDGLLQKWNFFAPLLLDPGLKPWIEAHVAVGRYHLETRLLSFSKDRRDVMAGFLGCCRLVFLEADPGRAAACHALAAFAFYAGVGRRTTMGMGQVANGE
ncbi:MAG TPA: CRISPR system precrRNA processing endoribonuclease RAMP protein Cas6 [Anaerolineae bacterium]|nr:CRISPR system precrRNA processing endoribonuclease RAMP protein Cas6 [Anaerolineae bacterium]